MSATAAIRVSIVEDTRDLCDTLGQLVDSADGMQCISTHYTGEDACKQLVNNPPDIVLIDLGLPGMSGQECIRSLKEAVPGLLFLVLTIKSQDDHVFDALRSGASGYLLKTASPDEILAGIQNLYDGGAPMSATIARKVVDHLQRSGQAQQQYDNLLTSREKQVLSLLSKGMYYKEIADQLFISTETVKSHCHNIYEKLHVSSRTEALNKYYAR